MDLRSFLLEKKMIAEVRGNLVYFSDRGLFQEPKGDEFWIFVDEGNRCGGFSRQIPCTLSAIEDVLCGVGKQSLWEVIKMEAEENGFPYLV